MTNHDVARVFSNIATMLEMEGANPFRVRAYREGARVIEAQAEPIAAIAAEEGRLESLPGIGKDLAAKIRDVVKSGTTSQYEELKSRIPLEVVELTRLQGLGPKRVGTLFEVLGVRNRADLEQAARAGRIRDLPGFGEKVEQNVLKAIATANQWSGRMLLAGAWPVAHALAAVIEGVRGVRQVEIAGSFRRRRETVGDLDLLVCGGEPEDVMEALASHDSVAEVLGRGGTKTSVRLANGLQVDLRLVPEESFGAALLYFTGSKEHNIELRKIAIEKGMSLNEYGLTRGRETVAGRTEQEVYRALGAEWIPPELRESLGEIELARFGKLPELLELEDLRGDLHMHTDRSDGRDSLEAMVRAARDRGYEYVAITEHSKSLTVARGFDEARVLRSVSEIEAVRARVPGIRVLHGLEVDILPDGRLDLDDEALERLDWVIVSLHSRLDQPAEVVTPRVLKALEHPAVCAMAHPTGRMIGVRDGAALDLDRVFEVAAKHGVAMEINAQPDRTDLSDVHARLARERGVGIVIDTDAHSTGQLEAMRFGVFAARRAGLTKADVLNALPFPEMVGRLPRMSRRPVPAGAVADAGGAASAAPAPYAESAAPARVPAAIAAPAVEREAPAAKAPAKRAGGRKATVPPAKPATKRPPAKRTGAARTAAKPKSTAAKPKSAARGKRGASGAARRHRAP